MILVRLLSVANPWGVVIVAMAGLWLSWSTKYIRKLVGNTAIWIQLRKRRTLGVSNDAENPTEVTSLLRPNLPGFASTNAQPLAKAFKENRGIRDLFADSFLSTELRSNCERFKLLLFTAIVALLASGVLAGGYFWAQIRIDGPARLASDKCGLWLFEGEKRSEAATRARMLDLEKEERAAQFAEDCYDRPGSAAAKCKILYRPTLPMETTYTNDCPFTNDICRLNRTVAFTTTITDAKDLGINSPSTPHFRRSTTCTPLSMEYPFIQNKTQNGTTTFTYHYGSKQIGEKVINHTYSTVGDPWDRLAPVYDLFAYSSNADGSGHPVWTPHPDLTPPAYSTVTIIFVSSLRILYEQYSSDPIFPADEEFYLDGDPKAWFRNSDPRARPLACITTIEVCAPDGKTCWNVNEPSSNSSFPDDTPEFILLYAALYKTDIYYSLAKRQGRSLLAQKKVSQYFSAALGDDPWVAEVENWVRTALARTSINAWSVAGGEDSVHANKGGFVEVTKGYGNLCGRYKYNPQGYQSLRFVPLMLLVAALPIIWILSWDARSVAEKASPKIQDIDESMLTSAMGLLNGTDGFLTSMCRWLLNRSPRTGPCNDTSAPTPSSRNPNDPSPATTPSEVARHARQTTCPGAETSSTTTAQEHQDVQPTEIGAPTTLGSITQSSGNSDEDEEVIEWEPLFLHLLGYSIWFLATRFLVLLVLIVGLPTKAAWERLHRSEDATATRHGVTAPPSPP